jgi:hypothetical protein
VILICYWHLAEVSGIPAMAHKVETGSPAQPTLYDRLGGVYNIAPVVDDLIDRVMTDPRLNANPRVDDSNTSSPRCFARPLVGHSTTLVARWEIRTAIS